MPRNARTVLTALALTTAAAHAQCDAFRAYMPDFDQRRAPAYDFNGQLAVPGLPGNGQAYCAPTTTLNRMAYISNRGYPNMLDGPRDYQSALIYDDITAAIEEMGDLMSTDPNTGTTGPNWVNGTRSWLNARYPGHFIVTQYFAKDQYSPSPLELGHINNLGAIVDISYGLYNLQVGGGLQLFRLNGHACTLRSAYDYCYGSGFPELGLRNPNNNTPLYTQATFATSTSRMDTVSGIWAFLGQAVGTNRTMWRFRDFDDNALPWRMLDGYNAIWPVYGISADPSGPGNVVIAHHPAELAGSSLPPLHAQALAGVGRIAAICLDPRGGSFFVRDQANGTLPPRLYSVDRATLVASPIASLTSSSGPIVCTRDADLLVHDGPMIRRFSTSSGTPTQTGAISLTGTLRAIGCTTSDDVMVDGRIITVETAGTAGVRLKIYNARTLLLLQDMPLPSTINPTGTISIACSPNEARFFVASSAAANFCEFVAAPSGLFEFLSGCYAFEPSARPFSLQVTDLGSLMYVDAGIIRERTRTATNTWVPRRGSLFDGRPSPNTFRVAVSASNWDPSVMTAQSFTWVPDGEAIGEDNCPADINDDYGVDGDDVIAFFELWDANNIDADINQDGGVDGDDVIRFFELWDSGC